MSSHSKFMARFAWFPVLLLALPGCEGDLGGLKFDAGMAVKKDTGHRWDVTRPGLRDRGQLRDGKSKPPDKGTPKPPDKGTPKPADKGGPMVCKGIPGVKYSTLSSTNPYKGDPAKHVDMNLLARGWRKVSATKGLVKINGPTDHAPPPTLYTLFSDNRVPGFSNTFQVQNWDWGCKCFKGYLTSPQVTLAGMVTKAGEVLRVPHSGYHIGGGKTAMVIHLGKDTLTLKYTREDDVVKGYTVHVAGVCIEPSLRALYNKSHAAGRKQLPALASKEPFGRAAGGEVRVAIRDTGAWMDPRSKKDWWQGK